MRFTPNVTTLDNIGMLLEEELSKKHLLRRVATIKATTKTWIKKLVVLRKCM